MTLGEREQEAIRDGARRPRAATSSVSLELGPTATPVTLLAAGGREIDSNAMTRDLVEAVCALSDRVTLAITEHDHPGPWPRTTIGDGLEYLGMPAGYELTTLVHAIVEAGRASSRRSPTASLERLDGARPRRRDRRLRHAHLTALPAGRAAGVQARTRVAPHHGPRDRGVGVRGRRGPPRGPRRPRDRRRRPLRVGGRGAGGRVRRARPRRRGGLTVPTLNGVEAIDRANGLLEQYARLALAELPQDARVFDAHTHLGEDIDGMVGDRDELLAIQRAYWIDRSFVFCLDEPDRRPAFAAANDRTLAHAAAATAELLPFVRLDLDESPVEEATRCIDLGARGIKLHPRAQRFLPDDPRLEPVFALAAERRVPILIHGGRGLPPIADSLARLLDRHAPPALIVAHAGIVDLAAMAENFAGRPGVFFDTSVWSPLDLLDLYRLVPPEQVVYASDYPYGRQPNSLLMAVRTARACGLDDRQLRAVLHDTATRIADGLDPVAPGRPRARPSSRIRSPSCGSTST